MAELKTALWKQNDEPFVYWYVGGVIRYRRPNELGFKSLGENEFWKYFKRDVAQEPECVKPPQAVQGGLFG